MFKGSRFLVPDALRLGLLRALHMGHSGVGSMIARAKEAFCWPGLKPAIESIRANCLVCHENAPSNSKQPSMGVFKTNYAYEALAMDHFFSARWLLVERLEQAFCSVQTGVSFPPVTSLHWWRPPVIS